MFRLFLAMVLVLSLFACDTAQQMAQPVTAPVVTTTQEMGTGDDPFTSVEQAVNSEVVEALVDGTFSDLITFHYVVSDEGAVVIHFDDVSVRDEFQAEMQDSLHIDDVTAGPLALIISAK